MSEHLPIYDIVIDEENPFHGVSRISLVDQPAIMVDWVKLSTQDFEFNFKADKEKKILYGPLLIPNMLIKRFDPQIGEFYVRFSKEQIEMIATKFNEDLNNKNINFMHTDQLVDGFVRENWLIENSEKDKSNMWNFSLAEGTWFGGIKINDNEFWKEKVKSDEVKGFSVEIKAALKLNLSEHKNKINDMEENKDQEVIETKLEEVTPTPGEDKVTRDEVASIVDSRFTSLMEEMTQMKQLLDPLLKKIEDLQTEQEKKEAEEKEKEMAYSKRIEELETKLSITPATESVNIQKDKKVIEGSYEDKFQRAIERVKSFRDL